MIRALPVASLLALTLFAVPANAHNAADCDAPTAFPTSAVWLMPPGRTYSYYLPARYFGAIVAAAPVDVTMFQAPCEIDATCHLHGAVGLVTCSTQNVATIEIHNPSETTVPLYLSIGQCTAVDLCTIV